MSEPKATVCRTCKRAVWDTDVDPKGRCVLCRPDDEPKKDGAKE